MTKTRTFVALTDYETFIEVQAGKVRLSLQLLKNLLERTEVREDYLEGEYGTEVTIPVDNLVRFLKGFRVETVEGPDIHSATYELP